MDEKLKSIVENVVDGILNGAYDYEDFDGNIAFKLEDVMSKYTKNGNNETIVRKEFTETIKQIREEVNNNWKVKKHNAHIDTIRKLRLGTKEYYDFYNGFYDKE